MRSQSVLAFAVVALAMPAAAATAPIVVNQNNGRNISRVIEQRSSVVNIDTARTVTSGATTVTEIVRIGPEPAPLVVSQTGQINRAVTFQQGRAPRVRLRQSGAIDTAETVQREMP